MNLTELFKTQAELDSYIGKSKDLNMQDYKTERIIALQVEFNELINELPFLFKYWSNKNMDRDKALEEYVDCLHFILSIGNDLEVTDYEYTKPSQEDMRSIVIGINNMTSSLAGFTVHKEKLYPVLVDHFILFGEKLGFTEEEIVQAYHKKNEVNYSRQNEEY